MVIIRTALKIFGFAILSILIFITTLIIYVQPPSYKKWPYKKADGPFLGLSRIEYADVVKPYENGKPIYTNRVEENWLVTNMDKRLYDVEWAVLKLDKENNVAYFRSTTYLPVLYFSEQLKLIIPHVVYEQIATKNGYLRKARYFPSFEFFAAFRR